MSQDAHRSILGHLYRIISTKMSITLDKNINNQRVSVLETKPANSEDDIILHFFSTFDDDEEQVTISDVEQKGNWLIFDVTSNQIPNRSGQYIVEFHTTATGSVALDQLFQPFDTLESPLDDLEAFRKDVMFGKTVGYIKNATNTLFKNQGRTITYKERITLSDFKERQTNTQYKEQSRTTTFKSQERTVKYKTNE